MKILFTKFTYCIWNKIQYDCNYWMLYILERAVRWQTVVRNGNSEHGILSYLGKYPPFISIKLVEMWKVSHFCKMLINYQSGALRQCRVKHLVILTTCRCVVSGVRSTQWKIWQSVSQSAVHLFLSPHLQSHQRAAPDDTDVEQWLFHVKESNSSSAAIHLPSNYWHQKS